MEGVFIVLFILAIVAIILVGMYAAAQRRKELAAWARRRGLGFDTSKLRDLDDAFPEFRCLHQGSSRFAYNVSAGTLDGLNVAAFDYHYTTGSGKNRSTHRFSAVILDAPLPLKPLLIRREGLLDKFTGFLGFDDIDFESAEFSREFYVKSPDRKWAYDVIHVRMMEYLMGAPKFYIQFDTGHVIAWRSRRFTPTDFDEALDLIRGILDRLPDYLVQQQTQT